MVGDDNSLVSIIVRTQNRPGFLQEALASLRRQTYRPLEIIVVNDSTERVDETLVESGAQVQVKVLGLTSRRGRSAAANSGLQAASGAYIGFLDDDDMFYPQHIARTAQCLAADPKLGAVYTDLYAAMQSPDAASPSGYITAKREIPYCRPFDRELLFLDNYLPINAVLFRRTCLDRTGFFDEKIEVLEDWDFWIRMALDFEFTHLCEITGEFRLRADQSNSSQRLYSLFPFTREYIHRKYAERTMPRIYDRMLSSGGHNAGVQLEGFSVLRERIAQQQNLLAQKDEQLLHLTNRLNRYLHSPFINVLRRLRCVLLRLPAPEN